MRDDSKILQGCIKNNSKAQKQLYQKYASVLLGICLRYSSSLDEAEDILQDVFIKIFLNIRKYSGKGSFEGWLKRIAVNTAITHYHKNLKHRYHKDINDIMETNISTKKTKEADFTQKELLSIINLLPRGYKMVFNMFAIEGYKHKEIAEKLEISINTSKSQYLRARKFIQEKLKKFR